MINFNSIKTLFIFFSFLCLNILLAIGMKLIALQF